MEKATSLATPLSLCSSHVVGYQLVGGVKLTGLDILKLVGAHFVQRTLSSLLGVLATGRVWRKNIPETRPKAPGAPAAAPLGLWESSCLYLSPDCACERSPRKNTMK